jgi:hypothetical protein
MVVSASWRFETERATAVFLTIDPFTSNSAVRGNGWESASPSPGFPQLPRESFQASKDKGQNACPDVLEPVQD